MSSEIDGWQILVVEDDYLIASVLEDDLARLGAKVVGPAPNVRRALRLIDETDGLDAAVLDVTLGDEPSFRVASALQARGIAFLFTTGYDSNAIPSEWRHVPIVQKPTRIALLVRQLVEVVNEASDVARRAAPAVAASDPPPPAPAVAAGDGPDGVRPRRAADICGELRDALASVASAADALQHGVANPAMAPMVVAGRISATVRSMATLIDELQEGLAPDA